MREQTEIENFKRRLAEKFDKLFTRQGTIRNFKFGVKFKEDFEPFQQKRRKIPLHIQPAVKAELSKLINSGHLTKLDEVGEDICVSPAVIARTSDGTVKIALDAKELNKRIVKKKMQMPNLDDLRDRASIRASKDRGMPFWASTVDLDYAFGQVELDENTAKHCVIAIVGGDCTGHYRFNRGFYGLADMPVVFQDKLDRVLEGKAPAWQDDMLVITKGTMSEHYEQLADVLQRLDDNGYKASLRKSKFFQKDVEWCGFSISDDGVKPENSRVEAIQAIKPPKTLTEVRSFLGSVQYLMRYIPKLTEKTEPLRQLLQKRTKWNWTSTENEAFENLK